jgi:SAM-dependent methyltransferase
MALVNEESLPMTALAHTNTQSFGVRTRFVATICAGSFLLFLVQPMVARMALPRLGGAPAVWNSAMLVYQALLLGGYAWAHWLGRFAPRKQAMIHVGSFLAAALMLPIGLIAGNPPADANAFVWVPGLLLASIGPLFFVVSAQAPLMQRWFTLSGGGDPYPLYAASNLGSFGGLIAYPLIVEPLMTVEQQSQLWTWGYVGLLLLVGWSAFALPRHDIPTTAQLSKSVAPAQKTVAMWILLAAVPSGLMLSTSLHLTTDIVAIPLLWVLPLGLYLLSFSVAFAADRTWPDRLTRLAPFTLLIAAYGACIDSAAHAVFFAIASLANLFIVSVTLHSMMFAKRPDVANLTRFYLAMSVGGVVGGIFCALVAPLVFDWTYEHPILLALSGLLVVQKPLLARTATLLRNREVRERITLLGIVALFFISQIGQGVFGLPDSPLIAFYAALVIIGIALFSIGNRALFCASLIALMLSMNGWGKIALSITPGAMTRSFFGVYAMRKGENVHLLIHGTTVHGIQNMGSAERQMQPTAYFAPQSGAGLAMSRVETLFGANALIDVVGLGAGTLACYARPGQKWRFYEIDPVVVDIARNPKMFSFLSRCTPSAPVAIGDARMLLAAESGANANMLVVDAFSSDSVPMHMLTKEAFAEYKRHLKPGGLLIVNISNRYLDLVPVVAAAARDGWTARIRYYVPTPEQAARENYASSIWVAMAPDAAVIERLVSANPSGSWQPLLQKSDYEGWSDNYGSILPLIKFRKKD